MDNRVWSSGAAASPPSPPAPPSTGYPTPGDPTSGTPATKAGAYWYHQVGESLRAILTAAGVTPDHTDTTLLLEAIQRLIDAQSGNYALDTGAADAYVVALDPAITAYSDGLTVRVKAVNANTGASTLNAGGGAVALVSNVGGALVAGDVPAGGVFSATYIAAANKFYITGLVPNQAMSQSQGDARYAALSSFTSTLGVNGYQRLPGGFILQWGTSGNIPSGGGAIAVVFPIAFPAACYNVQATEGYNGTSTTAAWFDSQTNTGVNIHGTFAGNGVHWMAIGI